jgi:hypothetical protein
MKESGQLEYTETAVTIGIAGTKIHPAIKLPDGHILKTCSCATARGGFSGALQMREVNANPTCKG